VRNNPKRSSTRYFLCKIHNFKIGSKNSVSLPKRYANQVEKHP